MPDAATSAAPVLRCGRFTFDLARPHVMGILNVTPNSFSDGGRYFNLQRALAHAQQMVRDGADIVDIGGESTRPGAEPVPADQELARVLPLVEALAAMGIAVSVDTRKPEVMRAAIAAGAVMINDVNALSLPGAIEVIASADVGVCIMHMQGDPRTMQAEPRYDNVVAEVRDYLVARAEACAAAGVARDRIVLDPGYGFGKRLEHNLALVRALPVLAATGYPVLIGVSRKSSLGEITGRPVDQRLAASLAAGLAAIARGARILRVHDVRETVDVLSVWRAVELAV
ncbi:MAG: dihydropteroate synthase [Casimicrobiaceae bacterium]